VTEIVYLTYNLLQLHEGLHMGRQVVFVNHWVDVTLGPLLGRTDKVAKLKSPGNRMTNVAAIWLVRNF
jgi:hypothetical protein